MTIQSTTTSSSLLSRVRNPSDQVAWREFEERYRELIQRYCRRCGLQHADSEDVGQVVLVGLAKALPAFTYDPKRGRFRDYLHRCTRNAINQWSQRPNARWRSLDNQEAVETIAAGSGNGESDPAWDEEWVAHHYRLAMATVRKTFDDRSIRLFDRSVAGAKVAELAVEFDMSEQAVHKVRQRIRDRMQELITEQIREEDDVDDSAVVR